MFCPNAAVQGKDASTTLTFARLVNENQPISAKKWLANRSIIAQARATPLGHYNVPRAQHACLPLESLYVLEIK